MEADNSERVTLEQLASPSDTLIEFLQGKLPSSLALLRRLQFTAQDRRSHPNACILIAKTGDTCAAAAYLDVSKAPETQMWLYSTLEAASSPDSLSSDDADLCVEQVFAILRRASEISRAYAATATGGETAHHRDGFMVGSMHESLRAMLLAKGVKASYYNPHDKWLFRVEDLPAPSSGALDEDMVWDVPRREDVPLIISRTNIPKTEDTLMALPSLGIRLKDGTLIAWSFLGVDGSLSTLHCEEPYRGRGIAKALAAKIIRDQNHQYGDDGWCHSDVHIENAKSQGVCKSIGGKRGWRNSWTVTDNASLQRI